MRRVLPVVATALVGLGAAAGAVVGSLGWPGGKPPSAWVTTVVDATEAAGTAHVAIRIASTGTGGPMPVAQRTTGVVSFSADEYRLATARRSGGPEPGYVVVGVVERTYVVPSLPRPLGSRTVPDVVELHQSIDALARILGPLAHPASIVGVQDLGRGSLDGRATTRFRLAVAVQPRCDASATETVELWVDGRGRIVRVTTTSWVASAAAGAGGAPGHGHREKTVETLTLSDFGVPVTITAPSSRTILHPSGTGRATAVGSCSS